MLCYWKLAATCHSADVSVNGIITGKENSCCGDGNIPTAGSHFYSWATSPSRTQGWGLFLPKNLKVIFGSQNLPDTEKKIYSNIDFQIVLKIEFMNALFIRCLWSRVSDEANKTLENWNLKPKWTPSVKQLSLSSLLSCLCSLLLASCCIAHLKCPVLKHTPCCLCNSACTFSPKTSIEDSPSNGSGHRLWSMQLLWAGQHSKVWFPPFLRVCLHFFISSEPNTAVTWANKIFLKLARHSGTHLLSQHLGD